ncbi:MAG: trypsin-like peptidase domain-containing protein [Armatimonadetes bacterium]|nr:trypsin-like peptidase domain-containing protein [Armatimonadota bacterium]
MSDAPHNSNTPQTPEPVVWQSVEAPAQPASSPLKTPEPIAPEPPRAHAATNPVVAMLVGALLSCAMLGTGIWIGRSSSGGVASAAASGVNSQSSSAIVRAVAAVGPAVMNVDTKFGKSDGKSEFLDSPAQQGPRQGKGTGFVIDTKRGLMLTNAHVVAGAEKIQVTNRDGKKFTGRVLGYDRETDIAVVTLSNKTLPQARLATFKDAKELPIGDWAIAIGNPFAQENTVTVGVLSAVGRKLPVPPDARGEAFELTDMMQTDAAINPGNSGGPLVNLNGEVIGINTAIIPFGQGLGFTIPINKAKEIADEIIKNGKRLNPYIGVRVNPITDALKSDYGLPDKNGGLVQSVEPDSPASKSGFQPGDVIRSIDGASMINDEEIEKTLKSKKVGAVLKI